MRRLDLGLTQPEVAERLRVHPATLRNWELNHGRQSGRYLPAIRTFLGDPSAPSAQPLPNRLRHVRWLLGISQRELAERLEVDRGTVSGWETRRHRPSRKHRERIEPFLDLLPD